MIDRAEWLAQRRTGIGGSDVAPILGLSKWRTAFEVYQEKVGELAVDHKADDVRVRAGNRMQRPILDDYCETEGAKIVQYEPEVVRHPELPFLMNLDAVVANEFGDEWNADAKNVHWRVAEQWGEEESDDLPDDAFYQGHHYNFLSPTIRHKTDFAVLVGGEWPVRKYTVPRDDEFYGMLVDKLLEFWWHVENLTPPPPDFAHATTTELMRRLYPDVDPNREIELDPKYHGLAERYYSLGRIESRAKKLRDLMKGELLFAMGDAAIATIRDSAFYFRRSHVSPRRCKKCGFSANEEGSTKLEIRLSKEFKDTVPPLEAAATKLIEGGTI
jgi:putative phage-type endonuclease